jgi:hypothetical protein
VSLSAVRVLNPIVNVPLPIYGANVEVVLSVKGPAESGPEFKGGDA